MDRYENDLVITPRNVMTVEQVTRMDKAPEKRVELHLHTNMSAMDGVSSAEALIKRAEKWGHSAVAVTDHGVVQAFPEAMNTLDAIRKTNPDFKVIYGVEGYFVNDMVPALKGRAEGDFNREMIVFDVETTGLSNQTDRLTEIGAVKLKDGEEMCIRDRANKETLVTGGRLVMDAVKEKGVNLYPVDSEHSAIFQCLQSHAARRQLKKIILTASGGPFFGRTKEQLRNVTVADALKHPNWSMGAKITVDSATLMNKALEFTEAVFLFDVQPEHCLLYTSRCV